MTIRPFWGFRAGAGGWKAVAVARAGGCKTTRRLLFAQEEVCAVRCTAAAVSRLQRKEHGHGRASRRGHTTYILVVGNDNDKWAMLCYGLVRHGTVWYGMIIQHHSKTHNYSNIILHSTPSTLKHGMSHGLDELPCRSDQNSLAVSKCVPSTANQMRGSHVSLAP